MFDAFPQIVHTNQFSGPGRVCVCVRIITFELDDL